METVEAHTITTPSGVTDPSMVRYVFTLVHGTWARSWLFKIFARLSGTPMLQWYEQGAPLRQRLQTQFVGAACYPFEWSGSNSVAARMKATDDLADHLRRNRARHPEAQHFIIAHSHGGNIAYYALQQDPLLIEQISGIVSLSTPFLYVQPRSTSRIATFNLLAQLLLIQLIPALIGLLYLNLSPLSNALLLISCLFPLLIIRWVGTSFRKRCFDLTDRLKLPTLQPQLIVRAAADEASAALGSCQVGIWLIHKALGVMLLPVLFAEKVVSAAPHNAYEHMRLSFLVFISAMTTLLGAELYQNYSLLEKFASKLGLLGKDILMQSFCFLSMWSVVRLSEKVRLSSKRVPTEAILVVMIAELVLLFPVQMGIVLLMSFSKDTAVKLSFLVSDSGIGMYLAMLLVTVLMLLGTIYLYKRFYKLTIWLAAAPLYLGYFIILSMYFYFLDSRIGSPLWAIFIVMILPALIAPFLTMMVLGVRLALSYIYLDLSVEPAPPGSHTIHQFGFRGDLKDRVKSSLNHSIAYEACEIIEGISAWIRDVAHAKHTTGSL